MFLCGLLSFLIPETNGKTLAEIEGDEMYGKQTHATPASADASASSVSSVEKLEQHAGPKLSV